jgi:hypothetical protein
MISDSVHFLADSIKINEKIVVPIKDTLYHVITIVQKSSDSSLSDKLLENSITIIIALMAGLVALYQVKSNIVSSARIKWIEELRQEISQLYNESLGTILYWGTYANSRINQDYEKYDSAHSNFFILSNRIKMKLNISESDHKKLNDQIEKIEKMLDPENIEKYKQEDIEIILKEIVELSRQIFKTEWDKSKKIFKI